MKAWLKYFILRYSLGRNETIRKSEPLNEEQIKDYDELSKLSDNQVYCKLLTQNNVKKYKVEIISNMGNTYYENFECLDLQEYEINRMALRNSFYNFNNSKYNYNYIFKITFIEVKTFEKK